VRASAEHAALRDATLVGFPAGWGVRMAVDRSFAAAGIDEGRDQRAVARSGSAQC
jgi:hypothetical protein